MLLLHLLFLYYCFFVVASDFFPDLKTNNTLFQHLCRCFLQKSVSWSHPPLFLHDAASFWQHYLGPCWKFVFNYWHFCNIQAVTTCEGSSKADLKPELFPLDIRNFTMFATNGFTMMIKKQQCITSLLIIVTMSPICPLC